MWKVYEHQTFDDIAGGVVLHFREQRMLTRCRARVRTYEQARRLAAAYTAEIIEECNEVECDDEGAHGRVLRIPGMEGSAYIWFTVCEAE